MTNRQHIPREHPVSQMLHGAANAGRPLTTADMTTLDAAHDLPGVGSFDGLKGDIATASQQIAALENEGRHQSARELAEATAAQLAGRMTEAQRDVTDAAIGQAQANARDLADIDAMVRDSLSNY